MEIVAPMLTSLMLTFTEPLVTLVAAANTKKGKRGKRRGRSKSPGRADGKGRTK